MIKHGDRILVGLSGGKDSMTLLLQLLRLQAIAPVSFEVAAATVDPQYTGYDPSPLKEWCVSLRKMLRLATQLEVPVFRSVDTSRAHDGRHTAAGSFVLTVSSASSALASAAPARVVAGWRRWASRTTSSPTPS